jgi:hypothetical protein
MPIQEFVQCSGNVFADLNLPQADDLPAKAEMAAKIIAEIQRRRLTQLQRQPSLESTSLESRLSGKETPAFLAPARPRHRNHCQGKQEAAINRQVAGSRSRSHGLCSVP